MFKKILLTLLLLPALVYLFRVGLADFLRIEPSVYIDAVQKGKERLIPARLIAARERLMLARSWDESNPAICEYLGQAAFMRSQFVKISPPLQASDLRESADYFDRAIALRPNAAYLWADRAVVGNAWLEANERAGRGSESGSAELPVLRRAYLHAAQLAPWEHKILKQLVRVGVQRYDEFAPEERAAVDALIARSNQMGLNY